MVPPHLIFSFCLYSFSLTLTLPLPLPLLTHRTSDALMYERMHPRPLTQSQVLQEYFEGKKEYDANEVNTWSSDICEEVKSKLKDLGFDRYKFVVQVGQHRCSVAAMLYTIDDGRFCIMLLFSTLDLLCQLLISQHVFVHDGI